MTLRMRERDPGQVGSEVLAALGIALDGTVGSAGALCGVGGERRRQIGASVTLTTVRAMGRLGVQQLIELQSGA